MNSFLILELFCKIFFILSELTIYLFSKPRGRKKCFLEINNLSSTLKKRKNLLIFYLYSLCPRRFFELISSSIMKNRSISDLESLWFVRLKKLKQRSVFENEKIVFFSFLSLENAL